MARPTPHARKAVVPAVFEVLAKTGPGRGGPVHAVVFTGRRYDTGGRGEYLRATVRPACRREDIGPEFRARLRHFAAAELAG
ncbi:hypothetical protein ACFWPQ_04425 [Streptomyces sp. NPDC058464]|uniref:hypothetical protein n=1 Tax=Streptomyces sp. NPDC058464 TaxID=3346511 RepID=UPI00364D2CBB